MPCPSKHRRLESTECKACKRWSGRHERRMLHSHSGTPSPPHCHPLYPSPWLRWRGMGAKGGFQERLQSGYRLLEKRLGGDF